MKKVLKKIGRGIFAGIAILGLFLGLCFLTISLPPIQNSLVRFAQSTIQERIGTDIVIETVEMRLPGKAVFKNIKVPDQRERLLFSAKEVQLNLLSFAIWDYLVSSGTSQVISADYVKLVEPEMFLYRNLDDSTLNLKFLLANNKTTAPKRKVRFYLPKIRIENAQFKYQDPTKAIFGDSKKGKLNFANLHFQDLSGELSFLQGRGDKLEISFKKLSGNEVFSGFIVEEINLKALADSSSTGHLVEVKDLSIQTEYSQIEGEISFENQRLLELFDTEFKEKYNSTVTRSRIDPITINYFLPDSLPVFGGISLSGKIFGEGQNIFGQDLKIYYADSSKLNGDLQLKNFGSAQKFEMDIRVREGQFLMSEVQALLPKIKFPQSLARLGTTGFLGNIYGRTNDLTLDVQLFSSQGVFQSEVILLKVPGPTRWQYKGKFYARDFTFKGLDDELDAFAQQLNFAGEVKGQGITLNEIQTQIDLQLFRSALGGFFIDSSNLELILGPNEINGSIYVFDRQGDAQLSLNATQVDSIYYLDLKGLTSRLDLAHYGIGNKDIRANTQFRAKVSGDKIENINGDIFLDNTRLYQSSQNKEFFIPELWLRSDQNREGFKYLIFKSPMLDADIAGSFDFNTIFPKLQEIGGEARLYLQNNDSLITAYYQNKIPDSLNTSLQVGIASKDSMTTFLTFLGIPLEIGNDALFIGDFQSGAFENLDIRFSTKALKYQDFSFANNELNLSLTKYSDKNDLLLSGNIRVDSLFRKNTFWTEDLSMDINGADYFLETDLFTQERSTGNKAQVKVRTNFLPGGKTRFRIDSTYSFFTFQNENYYFNASNESLFEDGKFDLKNIRVQGGNRKIIIDGDIGRNLEDVLFVELKELDLDPLNKFELFVYDVYGHVNGKLSFSQILNGPLINANAKVSDFSLDDFPYGDIDIFSEWNGDQSLYLNARLIDKEKATLNLLGYYRPEADSPLDFNLITQSPFPLNYISPFVAQQLYGIEGSVNLESFKIGGDLKDISVKGTGKFEDAHFGVDYFQTEYSFNGDIVFDQDIIEFPGITLLDKNKNTANIYGQIRHRGLREFIFDLQLDKVKNFLIMDTKKEDNEYFYGRVFLQNGLASITGDLEKLIIDAYVVSGNNSRLRIPVTYGNNVRMPEYVNFIGEENKATSVSNNTGLKGFELNLTVNATEAAQVDLIFDERVGDIIQGNGTGTINMSINEAGDFSMFGTYEISKGNYLFTSRNIIYKKFLVKEGGRITWSGDPYDAQLDLDASYPLYTDIKDLIQSDVSLRVPVNVLLHMEGSLMKPEIGLSIELPNLDEQGASAIASKLASIQYDEQELNKQVFSLIVFNRFAPSGGLFDGDFGSSGVTTSISELVSSQLNYWLSKALGDNISVNVGTSNFQDVNLLVSATLFNDRVTIEREGTLIDDENSNFSVGNISIIIKLSENPTSTQTGKGEIVLEVFNRENLNESFQNTNQAGVGIFFKKDFQNLAELFQNKEKNKEE